MSVRVFQRVVVAYLAIVVGAACSSPTAPSPELEGGVVATFTTSGQTFRVFVTNPSTIADLVALHDQGGVATIPNGRILLGPGAGRHNAPWDWHLDPDDVHMASLTIEICDGSPDYVQDHLDDYVDVVGRYCPWGAQLVALADYRD